MKRANTQASSSAARACLDTTSIVISTGGTALIAASLWVLYLVIAGRIPDIVVCI